MQNSLTKVTETLQKFDTRKATFPEVARSIVRFFEQVNGEADQVPQENKEEFTAQFIEAMGKLVALINPYIEAVALSEESLLSSLDNPNYYDEDLWKAAQEAKEQVGEMARSLLPHLATEPKLNGKVTQEPLKPSSKKPPRHPPKSEWMRS